MFSIIPFNDLIISAVLITGGWSAEQSAEIYHPDRDTPCVLPDLPDQRATHTQDGSLICGGELESRRSCRRWNAGAWDLVTESLTKQRGAHTSWTPTDGSVTYLMGGYGSEITSEDITKDNSVSAPFTLQHKTA